MKQRHQVMAAAAAVALGIALASPPLRDDDVECLAAAPAAADGNMGPPLPKDDLAPFSPASKGFVATKDSLRCNRDPRQGGKLTRGDLVPCTFGLYRLSVPAPGGAAVFTLSTHLSGAIYKLTYRGKEFVNPVPIVGASMQTALTFDSNPMLNPTEAGCGDCDSFTAKSTSKLLDFRASSKATYTSVKPAQFTPQERPFRPETQLADCLIERRIEAVAHGTADMTIGVTVPPQKHWHCILEVLCNWNPVETSEVMEVFQNGRWSAMSQENAKKYEPSLYYLDFKGNRTDGILTATADRAVCLGIRVLGTPTGQKWASARYGTPASRDAWRKWSVTHVINARKDQSYRIPGGRYTWKIRFYFGDVDGVKRRIEADSAT